MHLNFYEYLGATAVPEMVLHIFGQLLKRHTYPYIIIPCVILISFGPISFETLYGHVTCLHCTLGRLFSWRRPPSIVVHKANNNNNGGPLEVLIYTLYELFL